MAKVISHSNVPKKEYPQERGQNIDGSFLTTLVSPPSAKHTCLFSELEDHVVKPQKENECESGLRWAAGDPPRISLTDSSLLENKEKTVIHLFVCKVPGDYKIGSSVLREEILTNIELRVHAVKSVHCWVLDIF